MARRLDDYVVRGEIRNSRLNTVSGWLEVLRTDTHAASEAIPSTLILLSFTGNLAGDLYGSTFRFEVRESDKPTPRPPLDPMFQPQQIGAMGDSVFRMVRVPLVPVDEFLAARKRGETPLEELRASIYLEWYSQNGRVVLELLDPKIEFEGDYTDLADPEPLSSPEDTGTPGVTTIIRNADGTFDVLGNNDAMDDLEEPEDSDPFDLFPKDLDAQIRESAAELDLQLTPPMDTFVSDEDIASSEVDADSERSPRKPRDWSEVIPGIDPQTKAMYEAWDEVIYGTKDEPLTWLFEEPLCLPKPDDLRDESHAWQVLASLLAAMALRGVAFDMCPHFTALRAYRLLIDELLPQAGVHPNLVATGFVKHYCSSEHCEACDAESKDLDLGGH